MPSKRLISKASPITSSKESSLSPPPDIVSKKRRINTTKPSSISKPKSKSKVPAPTDEFQQVTKPEFVNRYRVDGLGEDVYYQSDFINLEEAERWYEEMLDLDTYQPTLKMYGRTFPQSRQIAAYSTVPDATLKYSGSTITMNYPFPPVLERIRKKLELELGVAFNHVMLNRYDDGSVYIGKHSDNLNNLVIASVSLGAERTFIMSPRMPNGSGKAGKEEQGDLAGRKNVKWTLANGSLVIMQGHTQEYWKHEIPKEPKIKAGRISLTFRQLV